MNKLIEKAKSLDVRKLAEEEVEKPTDEELALFMAVFNGEVTMKAACGALGKTSITAFYSRWTAISRILLEDGRMKID